MNTKLLHTEIQVFISGHIHSDISKLILKGSPFDGVSIQEIVEQIEAKRRCEKKLSKWFTTPGIYYPNKLNIEQTSSEITAQHKASLVSGERLIDITGGFGVDAYYFSKRINRVTHCEINKGLSDIVAHNYNKLGADNISTTPSNGIEYLKERDVHFDWIYIDPSRRDDSKNKVFLLSDCTPNLKTFKNLFIKYAPNVMVKTSPLLDISASINELSFTKEVHVVAVNNEVKELLFILERNYTGLIKIFTLNIQKAETQKFEFFLDDEAQSEVFISNPQNYLYEPNAAILKSGAFKSISGHLKLSKLHQHSHLYTSEKLVTFPGRRFQIKQVLPYNKKEFSKLKITKANVTTRNFPLSVNDIRKKLNVKDGGHTYLFFTTDMTGHKIIIVTIKV